MPWPLSWLYFRKKAKEYKRRFPGARISAYARIPDKNVQIGRGTYGSPTILLFTDEDCVDIGNYTSIGPEVMIVAGGNHDFQKVSTYPLKQLIGGGPPEATSKGPVRIGHDVWLGSRVMVLSGVTIGNGAVIAAGSVVVKDIPAFAIAAGVPAKVLRYRFDKETIKKLEEIAWWEWTEKKIKREMDLFYRRQEEFIQRHFNSSS